MRYFLIALLFFATAIGGGYAFAIFSEQMENLEQRLANPRPAELPPESEEEDEPTGTGFRIVINLASRSLTLYENGIKTRLYPVAVGKEWTPTPTGRFIVEDKQEDPSWADPRGEKAAVPPGEDNPLGTRWMGIGGYYGIHGTNAPSSIGDYMSNGCIRMFDEDARELFSIVPTGTFVEIVYQRVVADRNPDGTVSLYCYPDGYDWQEVDVKDATEALQAYGVQDFANPEAIAAHIEASAGEPLPIAKSFPVWTNGAGKTNLNFFAVREDEDILLPAAPLFHAFQTNWEWNEDKQEIKVGRRTLPALRKGANIYFSADYLEKALRLVGSVNAEGQFELSTNLPQQKHPHPSNG